MSAVVLLGLWLLVVVAVCTTLTVWQHRVNRRPTAAWIAGWNERARVLQAAEGAAFAAQLAAELDTSRTAAELAPVAPAVPIGSTEQGEALPGKTSGEEHPS